MIMPTKDKDSAKTKEVKKKPKKDFYQKHGMPFNFQESLPSNGGSRKAKPGETVRIPGIKRQNNSKGRNFWMIVVPLIIALLSSCTDSPTDHHATVVVNLHGGRGGDTLVIDYYKGLAITKEGAYLIDGNSNIMAMGVVNFSIIKTDKAVDDTTIAVKKEQ